MKLQFIASRLSFIVRTKFHMVLLALPILLACAAPVTVSPTVEPTAIPATDIPVPTQLPDVSTFPNADDFTWQMVVADLERPVDLQADGSGRLFVIEKIGRIRIIENGQLIAIPFLNIEDRVGVSGNEQGLLGLVFHPNYAQNGLFFVNYTNIIGDTVIARFQASNEPNLADPDSEVEILSIDQPAPNHNGGSLAFGPDGYLYLGLGDGGSMGDPFGNGQDIEALLGKILRIDVDSAEPYAVPADNPFGSEVWVYGLRNPWRITFDSVTGDFYIADVGQGAWEEINHLPASSPGGANFGWNYREGAHQYRGTAPEGLTDPVAEYNHEEGGCSVTGGYVYRGSMPEWNGIYLYGDYCTGFIWGLIKSNGGWQVQRLFDTDVNITSFGQDEAGEVYLIADSGEIYKLVHK